MTAGRPYLPLRIGYLVRRGADNEGNLRPRVVGSWGFGTRSGERRAGHVVQKTKRGFRFFWALGMWTPRSISFDACTYDVYSRVEPNPREQFNPERDTCHCSRAPSESTRPRIGHSQSHNAQRNGATPSCVQLACAAVIYYRFAGHLQCLGHSPR